MMPICSSPPSTSPGWLLVDEAAAETVNSGGGEKLGLGIRRRMRNKGDGSGEEP
jgi:hypothetical protein